MSSVKMQGNASGTGSITIASPNTNSNQTITLPDATDTFAVLAASQTLTNKTLTTPTIATIKSASASTPTVFQDSNGTQVGTLCRAWVNFNGTTSPGTIRAQFNVSSVTKNSTGDYTVNFINAFSDTNYAAVGSCGSGTPGVSDSASSVRIYAPSAGSQQIRTITDAGATTDPDRVLLAVFR